MGGNVFCAVGYAIANIIPIEGTDGTIVVDTGIDVEQAREVAAGFSKITTQPLAEIIDTHRPHLSGARAYFEEVFSLLVTFYLR